MSGPDEPKKSNKAVFVAIGIVLISAAIAIHLADSDKGEPCGAKVSIFDTAIKCKEGLECRGGKCETPIPKKPVWGCRIFERSWGEKNPESDAVYRSDAGNIIEARERAVELYRLRHPEAKKIDGNCYVCEERLADVESRKICKLDE